MILFIFDSPIQWVVVIAAISLLFGANKLPQLARSLGQARREFKKGLLEAEEEKESEIKPDNPTLLAHFDEEAILEELRRRQAKQLEETTIK